MATLLLERALDDNGEPVAGARAYIDIATTTTDVTPYSDPEMTVSHGLFVEANAAGEFPDTYVEAGGYKITYTDAQNTVLQVRDNVPALNLDIANRANQFDTRAAAVAATRTTGNAITVEGLPYVYDAAGTALTTGDGRKWSPLGDPHVKHWGTDEAALRACLEWIESSDATRLTGFPGTIALTQRIKFTPPDNFTFDARGLVLNGASVPSGTTSFDGYIFRMSGSDTPGRANPTSTYDVGAATIETENNSVFAVGDLIFFQSQASFPINSDKKQGSMHIVRALPDANTVVLQDGLFTPLTHDDGGIGKRILPVVRPRIFGLTIIGGGPGSIHVGMQLEFCLEPHIENCHIEDTENTGFQVMSCYGGKVYRCSAKRCTNPAEEDPAATNTGYGVGLIRGTRNFTVENCNFEETKHAVAGSGTWAPVHCSIINNVVAGGLVEPASTHPAIECHENGLFWNISGNSINGSGPTGCQGIMMRGGSFVIANNRVSNVDRNGIRVVAFGHDNPVGVRGAAITGNVIDGTDRAGIFIEGDSDDDRTLVRDIVISGNVILNVDEGVEVRASRNITITGNEMRNIERGIRIYPSTGSRSGNIAITGNTMQDVKVPILLEDVDRALIVGVSARRVATNSHGIRAVRSNVLTIGNCSFSGSGEVGSASAGVRLENTTEVNINGGITEDMDTPLKVTGSSENISLVGHMAVDCANGPDFGSASNTQNTANVAYTS